MSGTRLPAAFLLAGLLSGCSAPPPGPSSPRPQRLQGAVFFLLDTVRADHLSCYGNARPTSPAIARLADSGVLFEQVVSAAPWTLPSVRTILSARSVDRAATSDNKLSGSVVESIRRAGYLTAAITEGGFVSKSFGLDLGFDEYFEEEGAVQLVRPDKPRNPEARGGIEHTFERARAFIEKHGKDPFFLFVHTYEPHAPHDRPLYTTGLAPAHFGKIFTIETGALLRNGLIPFDDDDLRYLEALYDGGIKESDDQVGKFLEFLGRAGLADRTLVVVTSDHGEEMGDHYRAFSGNHGHSLHDELLLVPLVLHDPVESFAVRRVRSQVRTIDILPTVAELLGVPGGGYQADGESLVRVLRGEETEGRAAYGGRTKFGPQQMFLRERGYKYIAVTDPGAGREPVTPPPPPVQLYDLTRDPRERTNLAASRPDLVLAMERRLAQLRAGGAEPEGPPLPDKIDPELQERLRSLGYVR